MIRAALYLLGRVIGRALTGASRTLAEVDAATDPAKDLPPHLAEQCLDINARCWRDLAAAARNRGIDVALADKVAIYWLDQLGIQMQPKVVPFLIGKAEDAAAGRAWQRRTS